MPSPSPLPENFSYREALELGYSKRAIYALRDAGEIELVSRGLATLRRPGAKTSSRS